MPGHTPKMIVSICGNIWHLSAGKKSTSSLSFPLPVVKYSNYLSSCQKSEKANESSWQKCWNDRWRDNSDFIGPAAR